LSSGSKLSCCHGLAAVTVETYSRRLPPASFSDRGWFSYCGRNHLERYPEFRSQIAVVNWKSVIDRLAIQF
jgi:hypothetical protein